MIYKLNITKTPIYKDGKLEIFDIKQDKTTSFPKEYIVSRNNFIYYKELSYGDVLKYEMNSRNINISKKILISQDKSINSLCVLKENNNYYKVYNTYNFVNEDGFLQTRITLTEYLNPEVRNDQKRVNRIATKS